MITGPSTTITSVVVSSSSIPFPITLNTDSPQATSSVSSLQNEISATLIPLLFNLIDTPDKDKKQDVIDELDKVELEAKNLLNKIDPKSEGSSGSCSGGGNIISDMVSTITCIDCGLRKVKSEIENGVDDDFSNLDDIKDTVSDIHDLTDESDDRNSSSGILVRIIVIVMFVFDNY
ncbi:hypothetical protein N7532_011480 [Penicillium argentinense]|uniref:Uncharacterized protein n=1 Tax=Penicillium argentinense TaxID=1131581 RepID=A0A9W9EIG8_9EURO|nr:uncharacterized protein N7532_011480 [Penicillium argentinense]KAJ5082437.1 hypothetical protein N7532_011480 [Penicillium argentinense]